MPFVAGTRTVSVCELPPDGGGLFGGFTGGAEPQDSVQLRFVDSVTFLAQPVAPQLVGAPGPPMDTNSTTIPAGLVTVQLAPIAPHVRPAPMTVAPLVGRVNVKEMFPLGAG